MTSLQIILALDKTLHVPCLPYSLTLQARYQLLSLWLQSHYVYVLISKS